MLLIAGLLKGGDQAMQFKKRSRINMLRVLLEDIAVVSRFVA
jgi:hypothetical protein